MMKGYWVCIYEKIHNEEKLKEYAVKAKPAVEKFSGKFKKILRSCNTNYKKLWWNSSCQRWKTRNI